MKKTIFLLGTGLAVSAAVYAFAADFSAESGANEKRGPGKIVRPVKIFNVINNQQGDVRHFPATIHSAEESMISFRVPGEIMALPVKKAQEVKKGDLLAQLDNRDFKNEVDLRQAEFDLAQANYKRIKSLWGKKVVSQAELDTTTAQLKSARAALKLSKDRLKDTTLVAPFDGRIAQIDVENHQLVQAQKPILLLQSDNTLEVRIQMPETTLTKIQQKNVNTLYQPLVTFNGHPASSGIGYPVTYNEHATSATPGTLSYEVTFTMPAPKDITIYPGMAATLHLDMAKVLRNKPIAHVVVPVNSVLKDDSTGKHQAWIYDTNTGRVNPVTVTLGAMTKDGITITSGLKSGEQIVAAGLSQLSKNMAVKPLIRERGI